MAVRLGKINLPGAQNLYTEEARTLVEQRVPEQQGSVFQDMGREPVNLVLEGLLLGEQAFEQMEQLRQAQAKANPLPFAADIVIGSELTDVVIESFEARQVAGYANRIRFSMRLREHIEEPVKAGADTAAINESAKQEAKQWEENSLATANIVEDPTALAEQLATNPALVEQLDMDDVGASVTRNIDKIEPNQLGDLVTSVANVNPQKGADLLNGIQKSGGLGGFAAKISEVWDTVKENFKKIDFSKLKDLGMLFLNGGMDYLKLLKEAGSSAATVAKDLVNLVGSEDFSSRDFKKIFEHQAFKNINSHLRGFLEKISKVLGHKITGKITDILTDTSVKDYLKKAIDSIAGVFKKIANFIGWISLVDVAIASYRFFSDFVFEISNGLESLMKDLSVLIGDDTDISNTGLSGAMTVANSIKDAIGFLLDKSEYFLEKYGLYELLKLSKELELVEVSFSKLLVQFIPDTNRENSEVMVVKY